MIWNAQKTATQWELSCDRGNVKDIAVSSLWSVS